MNDGELQKFSDRRVTSSASPQPQSRPSTTPNSLTPFTEAVPTGSPIDFNAIKQANNALNTLIESGEPLPSPAKKYIGHCTRSIMRRHADNTEQANTDQKAILQARKRNPNGKRRVIHPGKRLMMGAELIGVREAENVTKQRKAAPKKGTGRRRKSQAMSLKGI